jgi:stage V sporulation protein G
MSEKNINVRVFPVEEPKGVLRAFASVSVEDFVTIRGLRVNEGRNGLFVSMPREKWSDGKYHDTAFPTTGDLRREISKAIIDEYRNMTGSKTPAEQEAARESERGEKAALPSVSIPSTYDVRIYPVTEPKGGTKAFASVSFEDVVTIRSLRVVDGKNGLFVTMPQTKGKDDKYYDTAFPTTGDLRREITASVLDAYGKAMSAREEITEKNEPDAKKKDGRDAKGEKPGILGEGGTLAAAKAESERLNGERGKGKDDPAR